MKAWHFLLGDDFPADQPNDEPEELRDHQRAYRARIQQSERLWHSMPNPGELEKTLVKSRNDLEQLRAAAERERRNAIRWRVTLATAVVMLTAGLWWVKGRSGRAEEKAASVDRKVDAEKTAQVAAKIDDLPKLFEEASKHDGIISNPQTPADHYHKDRFAEVKADFSTARKSYNAFLASGVEFIDPYFAYTNMLKAQDGSEGAREVVVALRKNNSTLSMEAAAALLLPKNAGVIPVFRLSHVVAK